MKTRVLSGFAMAPLLVVIYFGGYVLAAGVFILTFFAVREYYKAFTTATTPGPGELTETAVPEKPADTANTANTAVKTGSGGVIRPSFTVACVSIVLLYAITVVINADYFISPILLWMFVTVTLCLLMTFSEKRTLKDAFVTLSGLFYVAFFLFHLYLIAYYWHSDGIVQGFAYNFAWLVVITAFGSDIFAYFTGVLIGRHKLAPVLSPKKTIEGSIGGIAGSTLLCGVFGWFVMNEIFVHCLIIGAIGGALSQVGDLAASAIKRKLGIKDYGHLIPGHG
ncbi:MAG: phosphatidate cytidylyltransferase, partial [Clostridiales Family XIII bacterium]|nr:phosphatidate cytidylyltransferase [Clostridiales Family XIII bacterium]